MTLALVKSKDNIIAISEDIWVAKEFYDQLNLTFSEYTISTIADEDECTRLIIAYDDVYLEEYDGLYVRRCDMKDFEEFVFNHVNNVGDACKTLIYSLEYIPSISEKKQKKIMKILKKLWKHTKHTDIKKLHKDFYSVRDLHVDIF